MLYLLLSLLLNFSAPATGSITVIVKNVSVESDETVRVGLYNDPEVFPDTDKQYLGKILPAKKGVLVFRFEDLAPGAYALASFQDEDNDGKLDKNFFGAPTEDYGFSRNPRIFLSAPDFEDCEVRVQAGKDLKLVIEL